MGSSKKGMLNVLIAAVLWGSSGVCAQFIMQESQMSSPFLTMTRLLFAGLILLMLGFVHGDRIFRVLQNRRDALSLLFFSLFGALTVQFTFLMTIEKSNAATATVLQFLSPTIIVALVRPRPQSASHTAGAGSYLHLAGGHLSAGDPRQPNDAVDFAGGAVLGDRLGVCRRVLYHLSFNADCPLRDAAHRRLEHAVRRRDAIAVLRRPGTDFVVNGSLLLAFSTWW